KSIDDKGLEASRFYILILDYLKDINRALTNISEASMEHVENNHKELKETRKEALLHMSGEMCSIFDDIKRCFLTQDFSSVKSILARKKELKKYLNALIERQISKIRDENIDLSPKNTNLYLSIILETKDLLSASTHLAELGLQFYVNKKATSKD
ncbi:MAG: inorganic phosphate transporter, partial [Flavobacteriales bacterium]|nr:inorganic phosphate transporter [Flavobacteriales bacterium]